jgi:uncharacterized protein (DUF2235 family)
MKIFILADGTWLSTHSYPKSNIYQLKTILERQNNCKVIYQSGIGTDKYFLSLPFNLINGGVALDIDYKIKDLYLKLIQIYKPGDTLHFIGYSRGAYIVRCLAGLIYNCGLPSSNQLIQYKNSIYLEGSTVKIPLDLYINRAYSMYRSRDVNFKPSTEYSNRFKLEWSCYKQTTVDLLLCLDTVGTLGIPSIPLLNLPAYYRFFNTKVNKNVVKAIHILAADERKQIFNPTLMDEADNVYQCLYKGYHSTIGGIDEINNHLSNKPLIDICKYLNLSSVNETTHLNKLKTTIEIFDLMCCFIGGYKSRDLSLPYYLK